MTRPAVEKPLKEAIDDWFKGSNGVTQEDFWTQYDPVSKPLHYMLFPEKGIEVRDVCKKLADKLHNGSMVPYLEKHTLFVSDYVQMMQYGMRFMDKNGVEDLKKMKWYLDKLIDAYDESHF